MTIEENDLMGIFILFVPFVFPLEFTHIGVKDSVFHFLSLDLTVKLAASAVIINFITIWKPIEEPSSFLFNLLISLFLKVVSIFC